MPLGLKDPIQVGPSDIVGLGEGSPYFLTLAVKADTQVSFVISVFWIQEPEAHIPISDACAIQSSFVDLCAIFFEQTRRVRVLRCNLVQTKLNVGIVEVPVEFDVCKNIFILSGKIYFLLHNLYVKYTDLDCLLSPVAISFM